MFSLPNIIKQLGSLTGSVLTIDTTSQQNKPFSQGDKTMFSLPNIIKQLGSLTTLLLTILILQGCDSATNDVLLSSNTIAISEPIDDRIVAAPSPIVRRIGFSREDIIKKFDVDGDGKLSREERQNAVEWKKQVSSWKTKKGDKRHRVSREDIIEKFDVDGDGELSREERQNAVESMGHERQRVSREDIIEKFDVDGDGELSHEERQNAAQWLNEEKD